MTKPAPAKTRIEQEGRLKEQIANAYMSCDWDRARRLEIRYFREYHPEQAERLGIPLHLDNVHKYQRWLASIPRSTLLNLFEEEYKAVPSERQTYLFEGGIRDD